MQTPRRVQRGREWIAGVGFPSALLADQHDSRLGERFHNVVLCCGDEKREDDGERKHRESNEMEGESQTRVGAQRARVVTFEICAGHALAVALVRDSKIAAGDNTANDVASLEAGIDGCYQQLTHVHWRVSRC